MTGETEIDNEVFSELKLSKRENIFAAISAKANAAETNFLTLLRYAALAMASLALISSAILLALGSFQQLGRTRVEPETVALVSDDVVPTKLEPETVQASPEQRKSGVSQDVRKRTLLIYQSKFKAFQRPDTKITEQEVVDFIWSADRIEKFDALSGQQLVGKDNKALVDRNSTMLDALALVETASTTGDFNKQLIAYRNAKKVNVCNDEVKTRSRTITSWDSTATFCPSWYNEPIGCNSTREIQEPYVDKVCEMKFPEEIESPAQQFASAIQRYADIADSRLVASRIAADEQTANNQARKLEGISHISTSGTLFLLFLGVMFLYLFVALERHHRNLRLLIEKREE